MAALDLIPPALNSKSEPPPLFDGTIRLYISLTCPYAQRVWIARNIKDLSQIQIVPIDLQDRPVWYKEKVYPTNKDPAKKEAANELLEYIDTFTENVFVALTKPAPEAAQEAGPALDYLENALGKFADGPFLLGQFSMVDIAYGPFGERFQIVFPVLRNYDITADRPKLLKWIQELHKIDAYAKTKPDPELIVERYKRKLADYEKYLL